MRPRLVLWSKALAVACYLTGAAFLTALVVFLAEAAWPAAQVAGAWTMASLVSGTLVDLVGEIASRKT